MKNLLTESAQIKRFFPYHSKQVITTFLVLINCIIQCRTVCLYKCRDKVAGVLGDKSKTKPESHYARLLRFFKINMIAQFITGIRQLIMTIAPVEDQYLIMDRTNWKIGHKNVNLLTIGGLLKNTFVPFHWLQLNKRGNSNFKERKKLFNNLAALFQWAGKSIKGMILLADREFIGNDWLEFLSSLEVSFVIRLKENMYGELSTIEGKKNFTQILMQTCLEIWHLCSTNGSARSYLYLCYYEKSKARSK
jgi:hypothetical protein